MENMCIYHINIVCVWCVRYSGLDTYIPSSQESQFTMHMKIECLKYMSDSKLKREIEIKFWLVIKQFQIYKS